MNISSVLAFVLLTFALWFSHRSGFAQETADVQTHSIRISFGHKGELKKVKEIGLKSSVPGLEITRIAGNRIESNDRVGKESSLSYGNGDVDELVLEVRWRKPTAEVLKIKQSAKMWRYLLEHGSSGQVARLQQDPWNQPDAPILTVLLNKDATEGFSFSLQQLIDQGAMWLPAHDIFLTLAERLTDIDQHIAAKKGRRTLDRIEQEPDATLQQFRALWKDFGNVDYDESWETSYMGTRGHLVVTAAVHGSIYKFAVDRWGRTRPDFASPHKFRMDPIWKGSRWKSQKIENGLPVIVTNLEKDGQLCEITQFAAPLGEPDAAIRGYVPSVFLTRIKISGEPGPIDFSVSLDNEISDLRMELHKSDDKWFITDEKTGNVLLLLETGKDLTVTMDEVPSQGKGKKIIMGIKGELKSRRGREIIVKLPSPSIAASLKTQLSSLDFSNANLRVVNYWEKWVNAGAQFSAPEESVNELFRANVWHALILPRHTLGRKGEVHMDLPYANTAYGQENSDWPVNQAVYVDYMIYGLRGYEEVAKDEFAAMFQTQQRSDGRIGGFANWGVYSPAHLYAIAQNYLLSGNEKHFAQLLPQALKALDWCLAQIVESNSKNRSTGLILGALNDLSHGEREWAFTQAYYVAGLELFGKALARYQHPRAEEVSNVSAEMKSAVVREFSRASVKSPVVQLEDGTWINYVPTDALTTRRMLDEWYPTDVDTGPLHLSRLGVIDPDSWLTTAMLNDHEDNLFLDNKGAANEPVYVQQANAYLLRDEPKAVIRSFYSLMACGFSHHQYSPLEHRWAHGQYYGPPSTDGAWFEIYRKMLLNEWGDDRLMVGQAIPREWLRAGKRVQANEAPTYFGNVSFTIDGESFNNEIVATIELSHRVPLEELLIRFRHPDGKPIRSVVVNGQTWDHYDVEKEQISIPGPVASKYVVTAKY